jgi:hypothetical protein
MSIMLCDQCERVVDTDFVEMFDGPAMESICRDCWESMPDPEEADYESGTV